MTKMKLLVLTVAVTAAMGASSMDQYFHNLEGRFRWYVAPEEGPVTGSQNGWFTSPHDMLPGSFGLVGNVLKVDGKSIEFRHMRCVRGKYTYRFTRLEGEADMEAKSEKLRKKPFLSTSRAKWGDLADAGDTPVSVNGEVSEIVSPAEEFLGNLVFENERVPVRMEVIKTEENPGRLKPDIYGLRYGPHWKHGIDIFYPEKRGNKPLPVVVNIHGGGWGANDKATVADGAEWWNEHGIAYAAIGYRYVSMSDEFPRTEPPVAAPLLDAARAVQMLRYKADELGLDPRRMGFTGGSAGAATCCWLALHDDLAEPDSEDPVARQSTKPTCVVAVQAQTSLDPKQMREWIPPVTYGVHAFFDRGEGHGDNRKERFEHWLSKREELLPWIKEFSPYEHASADDPPILLNYLGRKNELPGNPTHHPRFGEMLHKRLQEVGAESYFFYGEQDETEPYGTWWGAKKFFLDKLPAWEESGLEKE